MISFFLALTLAVGPEEPHPTITSAVKAIPGRNSEPVEIVVAPGIYREQVRIPPRKNCVTLRARESGTVTLVSDVSDYNYKKKSCAQAEALKVDADDFTAIGIRFANTASTELVAIGRKGAGQAQALSVRGDRAAFYSCAFYGHQAVMFLRGPNDRQGVVYFRDCLIEGASDAIYGGTIALFENCRYRALRGGAMTMANTDKENDFGFIFKDCAVEAADGMNLILGRPWRPYAKVALIDCKLSGGVSPKGWKTNGRPGEDGYGTAFFGLFNCRGAGADNATRTEWTFTDTAVWRERLVSHGFADERALLGKWKPYDRESAAFNYLAAEKPVAMMSGFSATWDGHRLRIVSLSGGECRFKNDFSVVSAAFRETDDGFVAFDTRAGVVYDFFAR